MRLHAAAVVVLALLPLHAQQTFRAGTRLVEIPVVVTAGSGAAVSDLTLSDFEVFDEGRRQVVISAEFLGARVAQAAQGAETLPAGVVSNRSARIGSQRLVAIAIDAVNTEFDGQFNALKAAAGVLRSIGERDRVAVYLLSRRGPRLLHDYTSAPKSLADRLERSSPDAALEELDLDPASPSRDLNAEEARQRLLATVGGLRDIASDIAGVPGRKALVLFSGGFPFAMLSSNKEDVWDPAIAALNDGNIALYPIDVEGVRAISAYKGDVGATRGRVMRPVRSARADREVEPLHLAADETGGRVFKGANDLSEALRGALADISATWLLTVAPDHGRWDGETHRLRVRVKGRGLTVRHRQSYTARADDLLSEKDREQALAETLQSPLDAGGLPLRATAVRHPQGGWMLTLNCDAGALTLVQDQGHWSGGLDVQAQARGAEGRLLRNWSDEITLALDDAQHAQMRSQGVLFQRVYEEVPGAVELRVAVVDHRVKRTGSLRVALK